ncbi:MAG TPA: 3'(2'),5'-bisphosphate nucleotidase CysQ [Flavobacteriales bacterium]|nr:3'(2'),5'-bisphosphate nucleotidase CysQ [Flavobacteriales bacterium]
MDTFRPVTALPDLLQHAIAAAFAAGRGILDVYARPIDVELKDDRSPLTEADRRAHAAIVAALAPTVLPVLSEEGKALPVEERQPWERYWLVDPLDGTKEFIKRNGEFTVNIALMRAIKGEGLVAALGTHTPGASALYVPAKDILYFAWEGGGAFRVERAATRGTTATLKLAALAQRLPLPMPSERPFTIVSSRSHAGPDTSAFIARMRMKHGDVALTSMGSALKICLVAEGAADAYPRYAPTMEWDTAAGQAIANETGKALIDVTTDAPMRYNKHTLVNNWFIVQ